MQKLDEIVEEINELKVGEKIEEGTLIFEKVQQESLYLKITYLDTSVCYLLQNEEIHNGILRNTINKLRRVYINYVNETFDEFC